MSSLIEYEFNLFSYQTPINCLRVYKSVDSKVVEN
jgi:hypothetical protein